MLGKKKENFGLCLKMYNATLRIYYLNCYLLLHIFPIGKQSKTLVFANFDVIAKIRKAAIRPHFK